MFGGILDSIPVVGHAKGMWHYATGDRWAAAKAIYEATRSSAVMAGAAAGALGGPAGMIAGATAAGALTDTAFSVVSGQPKGVISGVSDIVEDISNGEVPLGAIARTGLIIGSDIVGGAGGAAIGNCATKVIGESAGKSVGKAIVRKVIQTELSIVTQSALAHGTSRVVIRASEEDARYRKWVSFSAGTSSKGGGTSSNDGGTSSNGGGTSSNGGGTSSKGGETSSPTGQSSGSGKRATASKGSKASEASSTSGSGGQRPNNNHNNKKQTEQKTESHWEAFLKIFKKKTLEEIFIGGKNIFKGLNEGQKHVLKKLIIEIRRSGYLDLAGIVNITTQLMSQLEENDVNFQNFQSLIKFVVAYVHEMLTQRNDAYNQAPSNFPGISENYDARRRELAEIIISEITKSIDTLFNLFKGLANKIKDLMKTIKPQFVNIFAAVYHYFKHKLIPGKNAVLDVVGYFRIAREILNRLKMLPEYEQLVREGHQRIVYERYSGNFGRRLMIVLKFQAEEWKLSSCYYIDEIYEDDEDGDEWLNGKKLPRR